MSLFEVTQFSKQSLQLIYIRSKKQRRSTGATEKRPRDPEAVKSKDLGRTRGLRATQPLVHVTFFVGRGCWLFLNYFCRTNVPPMTQIRAIHLAIAQPSIFAITLPRNRSIAESISRFAGNSRDLEKIYRNRGDAKIPATVFSHMDCCQCLSLSALFSDAGSKS